MPKKPKLTEPEIRTMIVKEARYRPGCSDFEPDFTLHEVRDDPRTLPHSNWNVASLANCAARLQTTDQGAPVSVYTVAREMGHGGESMVRKVYGHLGEVRQRSGVVEYRAEAHATKLGVRLEALRTVRFGTTIGTTRQTS